MIQLDLTTVSKKLNALMAGSNHIFKGCSTDTRTLQPGELFVALHGPNFDGHDYLSIAAEKGAVAAMVDRDCEIPTKLSSIRVLNTREGLGDLAHLWRQQFTKPLIGITGSNGKTTVKEMLRAILSEAGCVLATKGNLNNDVGVPLTLFELGEQDFAVIEMGANHLGEIDQLGKIAEPDIGVVTLCAPAHLEGFGSVDNVALTKGEMFSSLSESGIAVINADDDFADLWREMASHCQVLTFGLKEEADVFATDTVLDSNSSEFNLHIQSESIPVYLPLAGHHNIMNALAAAACAHAAGVSMAQIKSGLSNVAGAPGRLQFKKVNSTLTVIDDTYNANPRSMSAGIDVLVNTEARHWMVLGDMGELGESVEEFHAQVGVEAREKGVEQLFCVGEKSAKTAEAFGAGAHHFEQRQALIDQLKTDLKQSDSKGNITILIKGSRSAQMETVVNTLTRNE